LEIPQPKRLMFCQDQKSKLWVANCVDFYLLATAKTEAELPKAFGHVYFGELLVAFERKQFLNFPEAPLPVQRAWANLTEHSTTSVRKMPWSQFVPAWAIGAFGKLYQEYAKADAVEVKVPVGVGC